MDDFNFYKVQVAEMVMFDIHVRLKGKQMKPPRKPRIGGLDSM